MLDEQANQYQKVYTHCYQSPHSLDRFGMTQAVSRWPLVEITCVQHADKAQPEMTNT